MNNVKSSKGRSGFQKLAYFILSGILFLLAGFNSSALASTSDIVTDNIPTISKHAAVTPTDTSKVYRVVEKMPEIIGGLQEVYKHISYPREAVRQGIEGRVIITFIVNKKGEVQKPKVLVDIGGGCGEAAIEAIKKVEFKPGRQGGKAVKVKFSLPITFELK